MILSSQPRHQVITGLYFDNKWPRAKNRESHGGSLHFDSGQALEALDEGNILS
jgi:hypothetical protein